MKIFSASPKLCMECNCEKGLIAYNYAGFRVREDGDHPFPSRIDMLTLPGDSNQNYLCEECASKREIKCTAHGNVAGKFSGGKPPRCKKCDKELNLIKRGQIPQGYLCLLPLNKISTAADDIKDSGYLVVSRDGVLHIVNKKVLHSSKINSFSPKIEIINNALNLRIIFHDSNDIESCQVILKNTDCLKLILGSWINIWRSTILNNLGISEKIDFMGLVSIEKNKPSQGCIGANTKKLSVAICILSNNELKTLPTIKIPPLQEIENWNPNSKYLDLGYREKGVPQLIRLLEISGSEGFEPIKNLTKNKFFSQEKKKSFNYNIPAKGQYEEIKYQQKSQNPILIDTGRKNGIVAVRIPFGEEIICSSGFSYQATTLLISENLEKPLTIRIQNKESRFCNKITAPQCMFELGDHKLAYFLDKKVPFCLHKLKISQNGIELDSG